MNAKPQDWSDSCPVQGGSIPGAADAPAFSLILPLPSSIPVLIAVPHAGRAYPGSLLDRMRNPGFAALRLEDRLVDRLAEQVAQTTGAGLLVAHAPRAMIDLNRSENDIDWDMFGRGAPNDLGSYTPGRRARSGLGLIPRRLPGLGELWNRRHEHEDLADRLDGIHRPYHACLESALAQLRRRWGAALLLDFHSMPSLPASGAQRSPEFVLGDRFGASCDGRLVATGFAYMGAAGKLTAHNRPYAGGYVLERHADPQRGVHALQLEIDRSSYLDSRHAELGDGFTAMTGLLVGLVRQLAVEVAELGRLDSRECWSEAAE
jgi:N-formylglutamate amidohydrolase